MPWEDIKSWILKTCSPDTRIFPLSLSLSRYTHFWCVERVDLIWQGINKVSEWEAQISQSENQCRVSKFISKSIPFYKMEKSQQWGVCMSHIWESNVNHISNLQMEIDMTKMKKKKKEEKNLNMWDFIHTVIWHDFYIIFNTFN